MKYDVIIIGGGMVGATLACALGEADLQVALVEAKPPASDGQPEDYDARVSAITRASESIFRRLGVWDAIPSERTGIFREMHVWDATGSGAIHFDSADLGEPLLGYIIENETIQRALEVRLAHLDSVHWFRPASLRSLAAESECVRVRVDGGLLDGALVVGADGTFSKVREFAGMAASTGAYGQQAVVATVKTHKGHSETAWQRFLPTGPLAFLPLPEDFSVIVWSTAPERAEVLLAMDDSAFRLELEQAFESRLGAVTWCGKRAAFPLRELHAHRYAGERVVLVGDAAHTIHPLAGQGVNLGFLDAAALAEVIQAARTEGRDFGSLAVLRRYERWRKGNNMLMRFAMDGFKWLFGSSVPPVRVARNLGLSLTDRLDSVKQIIMRRAMGLEGDLPAAARMFR